MKSKLIVFTSFALSILFIPFLIVNAFHSDELGTNYPSSSKGNVGVINPNPFKNDERMITIYLNKEDKVVKMSVFDYICGVVAGEMPASYENEALKAQAVAAYTYTVHTINNNIKNNSTHESHKGAQLCTDSTHCKAFRAKSDALASWGENGEENWKKIEDCVKAVNNKIIAYNNEPTLAVFHAMSSGKTENSKDVWGGDLPYLVSVESAGEEDSESYLSTVRISEEDFKSKMSKLNSSIKYDKDPAKWVSIKERSDGGGVAKITVGNFETTGKELRALFGLRSTNFTVYAKDGNIYFEVKGFGHNVGMSQVGANNLAKQGQTFEEILKHYYTGVEITDFNWTYDFD